MSIFLSAVSDLMIRDDAFQFHERDHEDPDDKQLCLKSTPNKLIVKGNSFEYFEQLAEALHQEYPNSGVGNFLEEVRTKFTGGAAWGDEELKFKIKLVEANLDLDLKTPGWALGHYTTICG